jgi:hypothetical protein
VKTIDVELFVLNAGIGFVNPQLDCERERAKAAPTCCITGSEIHAMMVAPRGRVTSRRHHNNQE